MAGVTLIPIDFKPNFSSVLFFLSWREWASILYCASVALSPVYDKYLFTMAPLCFFAL